MLTWTSNRADLNGHPETMACFTNIQKQLKISSYLSSFISSEGFMLQFNFKCAQSVIREKRNEYRLLVGKPEGKNH
jgi:hypothetical protein